jgi:hypothetical protein
MSESNGVLEQIEQAHDGTLLDRMTAIDMVAYRLNQCRRELATLERLERDYAADPLSAKPLREAIVARAEIVIRGHVQLNPGSLAASIDATDARTFLRILASLAGSNPERRKVLVALMAGCANLARDGALACGVKSA